MIRRWLRWHLMGPACTWMYGEPGVAGRRHKLAYVVWRRL